jgi:hypothetical protein
VRVLLVPSPLLGRAVYVPFAEALRGRGHTVRTADVAVGEEDSPEPLAGRIAAAGAGVDLVVPHSNAGRFAAGAAAVDGAAVVYVDALVPEVPVPPALADFVRGQVAPDGLLPGWTHWWPPADLAEAVPKGLLGELERSQPRVHPGFLLADPGPVPGWREQRAAYLAFGEAYAVERAVAEEAGWPTRTLDGGHLHLVVEPDLVAAEVEDLARGLLRRLPA